MKGYHQPYDTTLKHLLEDQATEMLPHLIAGLDFREELNDELLKPPLRADRVYLVSIHGRRYVLHIEFETAGDDHITQRMLEYYGILYRKYNIPILAMVIYPFRTSVASPVVKLVNHHGAVMLYFEYEVIRLWTLQAAYYLEQKAVSMYALLPAMQGATAPLLLQAVEEMLQYYQGRALAQRLLWFSVFLQRADTVSMQEKQIVEERLHMLENLIDEHPYIRRLKARIAEEQAEVAKKQAEVDEKQAEVAKKQAEVDEKQAEVDEKQAEIAKKQAEVDEKQAEGKLLVARRMLHTFVALRFPALAELAHQVVPMVRDPGLLEQTAVSMGLAPNEHAARVLLDNLADETSPKS